MSLIKILYGFREHALQAVDSLKDASIGMLGFGITSSVLLGYNPLHAIFGSLGQILFLMGNYVMAINKGNNAPKYPVAYWIIVICMGAIVAFMAVPQLVKLIGWDQYLLSFIVGALAQKFVDFINGLYKKYTKNEGINEE
jgi:hypothetical protein